MSTKVECAYVALHEALQSWAGADDACPDNVLRNESVAVLLDSSRTGAAGILNLLDASGRLLSQEVGGVGEEDLYEFEQPAELEIIVIEPDPTLRDRKMDDLLGSLAGFVRFLDRTLGGLVGDIEVRDPPQRFVPQGLVAAKAVRVRFIMILSAPTVFG